MPCEIPISTFETRLRICIIESRASRRERKLPTICLILRDENENLPRASKRDREFQSLYLKIRDREDVQAIFKSKFLPTSFHRDMLFYPYLRWANALVWLVKSFKSNVFPKLNFRQYLGLLNMLDKRKASHGVNSNQTNTITPPNSVASVTCVTFFKCSS